MDIEDDRRQLGRLPPNDSGVHLGPGRPASDNLGQVTH